MPHVAEKTRTFAWPVPGAKSASADAVPRALIEQYRLVFERDARTSGRRPLAVQVTEIDQPFLSEYQFFFLESLLEDERPGPHILLLRQNQEILHVLAEVSQELLVQRLTEVRLWPAGYFDCARELRMSTDPKMFMEYERLKKEQTIPVLGRLGEVITRHLAADPSESMFKETVKVLFLMAGHAPCFVILESSKALGGGQWGKFAWISKPKRITKFRFAAGATGFSAVGWAFIQPAKPTGNVVKFQLSVDRSAGLRFCWQKFGTVEIDPKG